MKTHIIYSENWQSIKEAIKTAQEYLKVFGIKITSEYKQVDVSQEYLYDTERSLSWLEWKQTKSLKAGFVFGLANQKKAIESDCVGLICDKSKALEDTNLLGQQQTLGEKQIIEIYAKIDNKKYWGFEYTAYNLIHELLHAIADYHKVDDKLHDYIVKNKKSLDSYKEELLSKICSNQFGLLPLVHKKSEQLVNYAQSIGLPIKITEGYRSPERQDELYKQKPKVTNAKAWESMHQYRIAFDIVFTKLGYNATKTQWEMIAEYANKLGFEWGGDWKGFIDKPHFELTFGKSLKDFQKNNIDWSAYYMIQESQFYRDLDISFKGDDVIALQKFLISKGYKIQAGPTGYFGTETQKALIQFQKDNNITPSHGYFGIKTRTFIANQQT